MTWKNHLALNLEELTEALSGDQELDSEQGEPSKGFAMKHRIQIAAFTCDLMIEEEERQDDIQKLVEDCIKELRKSELEFSEPAAGLFSRVKFVLKNEREWIRKIAIDGIQEKVAKFEEQLSGNRSTTVNENNGFSNDEVEHSNLCHTALVYNDDGDKVDEHGNTQRILSAKEQSQDGEYIEYKSEPPEDTEVPPKGGEYIECKLEPPGEAKMI